MNQREKNDDNQVDRPSSIEKQSVPTRPFFAKFKHQANIPLSSGFFSINSYCFPRDHGIGYGDLFTISGNGRSIVRALRFDQTLKIHVPTDTETSSNEYCSEISVDRYGWLLLTGGDRNVKRMNIEISRTTDTNRVFFSSHPDPKVRLLREIQIQQENLNQF